MAKSVLDRQAMVEAVLEEIGLELQSRVHFSTDPIMAEEVMPALDLSEERDVPGLTRHLHPIVLLGGNSNDIIQCLEPDTSVEWHCHLDIDIYHVICRGHVIVQRLRKDENGEPITGADGELSRETSRMDPLDWWYVPRGEPYAFWTEDERSCKFYRHIERPGERPQDCADPAAEPR